MKMKLELEALRSGNSEVGALVEWKDPANRALGRRVSFRILTSSRPRPRPRRLEAIDKRNLHGNTPAEASSSPMDGMAELWNSEEEVYDVELNKYRGLVLDLTYKPINVVCWRRALCLEILEKADVLEYYDEVVNSSSRAFPIPAVLRISSYVHSPKKAKVKLALNKNNIFLRDKHMCQYCKACDNLTVDHVVPIFRGGGWTWENLVTACNRCNSKKGNKTLEEARMELIKMPKEPREVDSKDFPSSCAAYKSITGSRNMPDQWLDYLPKKPPIFDN